jgi:uncharacterized protein (DUF2147 family)
MVNYNMKNLSNLLLPLLVAAAALTMPFANATEEAVSSPLGRWLTSKKDTVVRLESCEDGLCAYIDWVHPDEEQTGFDGQPLCGQKVMWGFTPSEVREKLWIRGTIYRADDDKTYAGQLRHPETDTLTVRGYIAIPAFGKSYTLSRVTGEDYPSCQ